VYEDSVWIWHSPSLEVRCSWVSFQLAILPRMCASKRPEGS